jgi:hypothetical protein
VPFRQPVEACLQAAHARENIIISETFPTTLQPWTGKGILAARERPKPKLQLLGKLVLNGPTLTDHDILGVSIYAVDLEEARALAEADPKVMAGYLTVEAIAWMAVPGDTKAG